MFKRFDNVSGKLVKVKVWEDAKACLKALSMLLILPTVECCFFVFNLPLFL